MAKKPQIEKILKSNPLIDPVQLREELELTRELIRTGAIAPAGYNLDLPYGRRMTRAPEATTEDCTQVRTKR